MVVRSILSELTTPESRSDVFAWYITCSTWGSAVGSEASGRIVELLSAREGWTLNNAYHALFWIYAVFGLVNAVLAMLLTPACEAPQTSNAYAQVSQQDNNEFELDENAESSAPAPTATRSGAWKWLSWVGSSMAGISKPTRAIMYKLWALLALDSMADGMVPYTLTNYYMDLKFNPAKSTLGDVTSVAYFLGAISSMFAGPLARKIGLINTMVFTHIPSSAAVLLFPAPNVFWMTIILLFVRAGLNNMDQAPRSAFIAAVVKPEERTAVMGFTGMWRTLSATAGPTITGFLASGDRFWIAFVASGAFRLTYDVGLYALFVNTKLHLHEPAGHSQEISGEDDADELASLASASDSNKSSQETGRKYSRES